MWRHVCTAVGTGAAAAAAAAAAAIYYNYEESQCDARDIDVESTADSPLFRFGLIADVQAWKYSIMFFV